MKINIAYAKVSLFVGILISVVTKGLFFQHEDEAFFLEKFGITPHTTAEIPRVPEVLRHLHLQDAWRRQVSLDAGVMETCDLLGPGMRGNTARLVEDQGTERITGGCAASKQVIFRTTAFLPSKDETLIGSSLLLAFPANIRVRRRIIISGTVSDFTFTRTLRGRNINLTPSQVYIDLPPRVFHNSTDKLSGIVTLSLHRSACQHATRFMPEVYLLLWLRDSARCKESNRRQKRDLYHLPTAPPTAVCTKRTLYIDFREIGWSRYIFAPPGLHLNVCRGVCPFPLADSLNGSNHAVLQSLAHALEPDDIPGSTCSPSEYSAASLLLLDRGRMTLKTYDDMVVHSCSCH